MKSLIGWKSLKLLTQLKIHNLTLNQMLIAFWMPDVEALAAVVEASFEVPEVAEVVISCGFASRILREIKNQIDNLFIAAYSI